MNEIKRNAAEFASSVTKKVIKMSKSNAGYKKTVKISDDLRIRFDGAVILDDDESGLIINLYLDKKYDRFFDNIKMHHSGFVKSDRKSVFADFHQALLDIINEWIEEVVYKELDKVVETFNNYVKEQVDEEYAEASAELDDYVIDMEDPENPFTEMDWNWDIKDMWVDWCYLNTQIDMDYVFDYFEKHREQFMNEDDICDYINDMYGDYVDDNCSGSCLIYKYTPEQWDEYLNSLNGNPVKNDTPLLDRDTEIMTKNDTPLLDGWVDGEWAWEDDGTEPKAPADPKMKEWMESLGCKFEDDEVVDEVDADIVGQIKDDIMNKNDLRKQVTEKLMDAINVGHLNFVVNLTAGVYIAAVVMSTERKQLEVVGISTPDCDKSEVEMLKGIMVEMLENGEIADMIRSVAPKEVVIAPYEGFDHKEFLYDWFLFSYMVDKNDYFIDDNEVAA